MVLTIKAIKYMGQPLAPPLSAVFDRRDGGLGRSAKNDLILADEEKFVSGEHAKIKYENGEFYYIDTSLNGTQITNRKQRIHHTRVLLEDQDKLRIGDYDLVVSITDDAGQSLQEGEVDLEGGLSLSIFEQESEEEQEGPIGDSTGKDTHGEDPLGMAGVSDTGGLEVDGSFTPPQVQSMPNSGSELPHDLSLDDFFGEQTPVQHAAVDEPSAPKAIDGQKQSVQDSPQSPGVVVARTAGGQAESITNLLNIFFEAAGIEGARQLPQKNPEELMQIIGTVFRELVDGLMMVLRGRSELKSHLRVSVTTLKATENNPLKFSPTVEEALITFLTNHHPGFVDAPKAVQEGYNNIKNHQLAIHAGVQASLKNILERFNPQHFSEKFEEGIVLHKKTKCWDEFRQRYQRIAEEALEDFFGEEFVCAYEQQINKLRRQSS